MTYDRRTAAKKPALGPLEQALVDSRKKALSETDGRSRLLVAWGPAKRACWDVGEYLESLKREGESKQIDDLCDEVEAAIAKLNGYIEGIKP